MIAGVVAGSIVGAALGVLYAPNKGKKTRRKIAHRAEETQEMIAKTVNEIKHMVGIKKDPAEQLNEKLSDLITEASYKTEDVIHSLEDKIDELKTKNNNVHEMA
jgi:gas vesicle protein